MFFDPQDNEQAPQDLPVQVTVTGPIPETHAIPVVVTEW